MKAFTDHELAEKLRLTHLESKWGGTCQYCNNWWPCPTIRVCDAFAAAEADAARVREALEAIAGAERGTYHSVAGWGECAVCLDAIAVARAALAAGPESKDD